MTGILAVNTTSSAVTATSLNASAGQSNSDATTIASSPASLVTLGQDTTVPDAQVYASRPTAPAWEYVQQDKVSLSMMGNFAAQSTASRFQGLGATLMTQLVAGDTDISQSVIRPSTSGKLSASQLSAAQQQLHTNADNSVSLTIKTVSGKTITLSLSSSDNGLAVQASVAGGKLNDAEQSALSGMTDAFQSAIDGFTSTPPALNLNSLSQFNSSVFSSVDLSGQLKLGENQTQTLSFHADAQHKSVQMSGPSGDIKLAVNLKNANALGSADQQAKALASYLNQFASAKSRGNADPALMSLFESAFSALESNNGSNSAASASTTASSTPLSDEDRATVTGLADFTASVTQTPQAINPMRSGELDTFTYQVSQTTQTHGSSLNRTVDQHQQSHLTASYHLGLYPGSRLAFDQTAASQNYNFYQLDDSASSTSHVGYDHGNLVSASLTQSATQNTTISNYVMGHLQDKTVTPQQSSKTQNLLSTLQAAMQTDSKTKADASLATLHDSVLLQANPANLT